jgi:hypothetical protein
VLGKSRNKFFTILFYLLPHFPEFLPNFFLGTGSFCRVRKVMVQAGGMARKDGAFFLGMVTTVMI